MVNEKKNVFVLVDSMVKHIQGWHITKKLENKHKVYISESAGSKVICMNDVNLYDVNLYCMVYCIM